MLFVSGFGLRVASCEFRVTKLRKIKMVFLLALIEMEILFSIASGLNPRQLKKDWNEKQEQGLLITPKPFAPDFDKFSLTLVF
jgi:hypothetical protein